MKKNFFILILLASAGLYSCDKVDAIDEVIDETTATRASLLDQQVELEAFDLFEGVIFTSYRDTPVTIELTMGDIDVGYDGASPENSWGTITQGHPAIPGMEYYQFPYNGYYRLTTGGGEYQEQESESRFFHIPYTNVYGVNWVNFQKPIIESFSGGNISSLEMVYFLSLEDANGDTLFGTWGGEEIWNGSDRLYATFPAYYGPVVCPQILVEIYDWAE